MYIRTTKKQRARPRRRRDAPDPAASESLRRVEAWLQTQQQRRHLSGEAGRLDAVREWGEGCFRYAYNPQGDLTEIVEADGRRLHYDYDTRRRLTRVQHADGTATGYAYDHQDRLHEVQDRGVINRYTYDSQGRLTRKYRGRAGAIVYGYDEAGRVVMARTSRVTTTWRYDDQGRIVETRQSIAGVTLRLHLDFDEKGRLARMILPGSPCPIQYQWNDQGRPHRVDLGDAVLARYAYHDEDKTVRLQLGNGVDVETAANHLDGRPARHTVRRGEDRLFHQTITYNTLGETIDDGRRRYTYDLLGRLVEAQDAGTEARWGFGYDQQDNRTHLEAPHGAYRYTYGVDNRLLACETDTGTGTRLAYDRRGRLVRKTNPGGTWVYRYDEADNLLQIRYRGNIVAQFIYDHKDRLVLADYDGRIERYLYSPADELLAVTDAEGLPVRLMVRTPLGLLAEVHGAIGEGAVYFRHDDAQGTTHLMTDAAGDEVARFTMSPFGVQQGAGPFCPVFGGHRWHAEADLYYCGARWYDPHLGRFLTPDTYTGGPDDERFVHPLRSGGQQAAARDGILHDWLKQPRLRNRYVFCRNDPIGHVDPNGHWSFGGVLLSLLGAIWTLPNTLFGILIEITCLIVEVLRWLLFAITFGNVEGEALKSPGFDVAASGRLNAFALVFTGGWLGSFPSLLGITFGNVFFVYKDWETSPHILSFPDPVHPPAYGGSVSIPRNEMLYEHELRHTNQYGWFGPFFHLGLPIWGVYLWDVIFNGYEDAWTERDAREHSESR